MAPNMMIAKNVDESPIAKHHAVITIRVIKPIYMSVPTVQKLSPSCLEKCSGCHQTSALSIL